VALSPTSTLIAMGLVEIAARSIDLEDKLDVWKSLPNIQWRASDGGAPLYYGRCRGVTR